MNILDLNKIIDHPQDSKIFFGKYSGFQRYDVYKYTFAKRIEEVMRNAFWNPNEVSLVHDRNKFSSLPEHIKEIITKNLLFQTLMDSGQNRGLDNVLIEHVTSSEWEAVFKTQAYFELIHSLSYSHILREVFPNATDVFDLLDSYPEIRERLRDEVENYNFVGSEDFKRLNIEDRKKLLLKLIIRIYALESVKFYVSFLVTYLINDGFKSAIQGITRIIKLIHNDEVYHVAVMSGLLNILRKNNDEGFSHLFESEWFDEMAKTEFNKIRDDEIEWGKYLLSHGQIPSLTENVLKEFVNFFCDNSLKNIKVNGVKTPVKTDMVSWFLNYADIDMDNTAAQEGEGLAYNIGILKNDLPEGKIEV